jgi:hypothetical protein
MKITKNPLNKLSPKEVRKIAYKIIGCFRHWLPQESRLCFEATKKYLDGILNLYELHKQSLLAFEEGFALADPLCFASASLGTGDIKNSFPWILAWLSTVECFCDYEQKIKDILVKNNIHYAWLD